MRLISDPAKCDSSIATACSQSGSNQYVTMLLDMEGDYHELIEKFGVENQCDIIEGLI